MNCPLPRWTASTRWTLSTPRRIGLHEHPQTRRSPSLVAGSPGELEGAIPELLQVLDEEAAGPSNDGDNHREPELESKHTIFLSHSGVQKNFTDRATVC